MSMAINGILFYIAIATPLKDEEEPLDLSDISYKNPISIIGG